MFAAVLPTTMSQHVPWTPESQAAVLAMLQRLLHMKMTELLLGHLYRRLCMGWSCTADTTLQAKSMASSTMRAGSKLPHQV